MRRKLHSLALGIGAAMAIGGLCSTGAQAQTTSAPTATTPRVTQPGHPSHHHPDCAGDARGAAAWMRRLGVTPQQRARIRGIVEHARAASAADVQRLRELRQHAQALFGAPVLDANALQKLQQQRSAIASELAAQRMKTRIAIAQVLTPEQRRTMMQVWEHRHHAHADHAPGHRAWPARRPMQGGSTPG